jgi:hypothetical protein
MTEFWYDYHDWVRHLPHYVEYFGPLDLEHWSEWPYYYVILN